jgi:GntR family transcriptional regulator
LTWSRVFAILQLPVYLFIQVFPEGDPMADLILNRRKIDKGLPVPYYYQIVQILREAIQDLDVSPDGANVEFPSEMELSEYFQVNRGTIRHALQLLEREGLIYREKGRGTFLRRRRVELDLSTLCSTTADLKARGWTPDSQILSLEKISPSLHIQRFLELQPDALVWLVYRLRLADNEPISLQWSYVPVEIAPHLDQEDLSSSLYYILKNSYGVELKSGDQKIRTRPATIEEGRILEIPEGAPVFEISRVTYDQYQRPIEHLDSLWRGDRYDLQVRLYSRE